MRNLPTPESWGFRRIFSHAFLFPGGPWFPRWVRAGILGAVLLMFGPGCSDLELTRAFEGEFPARKNNQVIGEYCTSCHIHKDFDSEQHLTEIRPDYRRRFFRTTQECRACHYLEKQWTHNNVLRKTRRPEEANRGVFRDFEKKQMKQQGKT